MKKVKMINSNESGFIGLSTSNAIGWESISHVRLCILSDLYYFNPKTDEKCENDQFQWKWVYRIKHVKCYRMKSISPDRLCILSDLYYYNPKIHENEQFQWKRVYRIGYVKCYRMKSISPDRLCILSDLYF